MLNVTFSELRNNAKKYFDAVEAGETLEVFRRGKPVAIITPIAQHKGDRWKRADPLDLGTVSLSRILLDERYEGR